MIKFARVVTDIATRFQRLSQTAQFALAGGLIILVTMIVVGFVITAILVRTTIDSTASRSALFIESLLSPLVQDLAQSQTLTDQTVAALDETLKRPPFNDRFLHVDIWLADGTLAYSTSPTLIGRQFDTPIGALSAFEGNIEARYTDLKANEHITRGWKAPFLEIYVPLLEERRDRIIAVVEVHEHIEPFQRRITHQRLQTWLIVMGVAGLIGLILIGIVWQSSKVEIRQRKALSRRLRLIEQINDRNRQLREKVQRASANRNEIEEAQLRKLGAELHDGPAQLVGLAILKLEDIRQAQTKASRDQIQDSVESVLKEAMQSLREIARGLILPEIRDLSLHQTLTAAVQAHERRTGSQVLLTCSEDPIHVPIALRICAYRFVQEGLNNAFRHAKGNDQSVDCVIADRQLLIRVSDTGTASERKSEGLGLGLIGLRERIESFGGTFAMKQTAFGTFISMTVKLEKAEA